MPWMAAFSTYVASAGADLACARWRCEMEQKVPWPTGASHVKPRRLVASQGAKSKVTPRGLAKSRCYQSLWLEHFRNTNAGHVLTAARQKEREVFKKEKVPFRIKDKSHRYR